MVEAQHHLNPAPAYGRVLSQLGIVVMRVWPIMLAVLLLLCLPWEMGLSYFVYTFLDEDVQSLLVISLLSTVGQLSAVLLAETIVVAAAWRALQNEEQDIPAILWRGLLGFVYVFPAMLLSFFAIGFAMIACLLPGIYLNVRWMYILPIAVVEGRGGVAPLQRSWQMTNVHQLFSIAIFFLFVVPMTVVMVAVALPSEFLPEIDNWTLDAILTLVSDLATMVVCCGFTCTYYELLKSQAQPAKILPEEPALVAAAFADAPRFGE